MTLLRQIQDAATEADVPLTTVLRKCTILATRLRHDPLKAWVTQELNGYENVNDLPEYRRQIGANVLGTFTGPFGSGLKNAPLPEFPVDEEYREFLFTVSFMQPVADLERIVQDSDGGIRIPWPADFVVLYAGAFYENMNALSITRVVARSHVAGILDTIRTRVLEFSLEIEQIAPDAGEDGASLPARERVTQIFNTNIFGGQATVAARVDSVTQTFNAIPEWAALEQELMELGIPSVELDQLRGAVESDAVTGSTFGERTRGWLGNMTAKIATGAVTGTTAEVLAGVVLRHLS